MARSIDTAKPKNMKLTELIKKRTELKESAEIIDDLLVEMYLRNLSTKELANQLNLPIPVLAAIRKELKKLGFMTNQGGLSLSRKGRVYVEQQLGLGSVHKDYYLKLLNSQEERQILSKQLLAELSAGIKSRPTVEVAYDQAFATLETSVARAVLLLDKHQLINKKILFLGDDDLTSLAVGLLLKKISKSQSQKEALVVYEMSPDIIACLEQSARHLGLELSCHQLDFRQADPDLFLNQFDSAFVDPPYTLSGLKLFLSRAIAASKLGSGTIYLSFGKKEPEVQLAVQHLLSSQQLTIKAISRGFNQYEGAGIIGGQSDLYQLTTNLTSYPVISPECSYKELIYTGELTTRIANYQCDSCQENYQMKRQGTIKTIEVLKQKGCRCGGTKFTRLKAKASNSPKKTTLGNHYLLELFNCSTNVLSSVNEVEAIMLRIVDQCQLTAVNHCFHQFEPEGVSGVVILAESHFTIHTWPELNYAAVDLFVCQELRSESDFISLLRNGFGVGSFEYQRFKRGAIAAPD